MDLSTAFCITAFPLPSLAFPHRLQVVPRDIQAAEDDGWNSLLDCHIVLCPGIADRPHSQLECIEALGDEIALVEVNGWPSVQAARNENKRKRETNWVFVSLRWFNSSPETRTKRGNRICIIHCTDRALINALSSLPSSSLFPIFSASA